MPELKAISSLEETRDNIGAIQPPGVVRIVLTGFMGAGKSTVGALLAAKLGWRFVDIDAAIEAMYGASIASLFEQRGEPWFREVEQATILDFLGIDHLVLALGGGAIETEQTLRLLLASVGTRLVHLEASLDTVLARCVGTETVRPVLRDKANLESRYTRRLPLYRQAHVNLPVDAIAPESVTEMLCSLLGLG